MRTVLYWLVCHWKGHTYDEWKAGWKDRHLGYWKSCHLCCHLKWKRHKGSRASFPFPL